jgi:phospholipase/carboxylesterase
MRRFSRRDILRIGSAGLVASLAACTGGSGAEVEPEPRRARLAARPGGVHPTTAASGTHRLGLESSRDGVLYTPRCPSRVPTPLVLMLHGAGGHGARALRFLERLADEAGFLVLCPDSRGRTWDAIIGGFGSDVEFIDRALAHTFSRHDVDRSLIAAAGFSDGATYALALIRANGDLFSHGIGFSPGFVIPVPRHGLPRLFVSHGIDDEVLPIDRASRPLVRALRDQG